jgi:hypothetical protein
MIKKIPIEPTYRKDNGGWNLSTDSLPIPKTFKIKERNIVYIPPGEYGGNHKHPRAEAFVGVGDNLSIIWQDDKGHRHEEKMMEGERLFLFTVEPFTPHVVVNRGAGFAVLAEFADGTQLNVERVEVLNSDN